MPHDLPTADSLSADEELLRYSRQIMLPQIDIKGQQALLKATVIIIGLGGLGSVVSMYLASSGIGRLILVDPDQVELTNLQRQIVHTTERIGMFKVESAAIQLTALNPTVELELIPRALSEEGLIQLAQQADIVVDCTDNLSTRFLINRACVQTQKPLVSGAAIRWEGQVSVFDSRKPDSPCYHCFYGELTEVEQACSVNGVISPLLGMIGSTQALEVIKLLTGAGKGLVGRVLLLDALAMEWHSIVLPKNPQCRVCGVPHA
ncbi:HesA/MoeB/ThiF family protein [Thiofilum flexile]|uniref:HesA/MoeB/ThiF family protein n=1 Tax=Thiofilum flexile TaxID=125627 RepID=UPI0003703E7B|nr:molybdopterin-synthase adenylyltransferase MoeB [Thiofilum flexile]